MMLATALAKMIHKTECVIFVDSKNSIRIEDSVEKTYSPWLYYELAMIGLIERRSPEDHRIERLEEARHFSGKAASAEMLVQYDADMTSLSTINVEILNRWGNAGVKGRRGFALDVLYEMVPED